MILAKEFLRDQQIIASPDAPQQPAVSVILPTYRRCRQGLLERALRSVLAQSYPDFELLVMDDGSSDGSADLIANLQRTDARIIHVRHDLNSGLPALRVNEGIALAKGGAIAFQFDDDVWRPQALEHLIESAAHAPQPALVIGGALVHNPTGKVALPEEPVTLVSLARQNRFANNSVLLPRAVFAQYGMYDMHIAMRRLTDWDLWLRLVRQLPFVEAGKVVADVYEMTAGAIGLTTPFDLDVFSFIQSIPRGHLLTLETWQDYPVDGLEIGDVALPGEFRRRVYEDQIAPFYNQRRHAFPQLGSYTATLNEGAQPQTLMYTQQSYEVSNEVALRRYDALSNARGSFKGFYQSLSHVHPGWSANVDVGLLVRTVQDEALEMLAEAEAAGRPLGLYLDDDLFTFHEYGPQFNYLAPGSRFYENLVQAAEHADATLATNEFLAESARAFTPRVVPHNGAIPDDALPDALRRRGRPVRIAYVGSQYRIDEFRAIWDALLRISKEYGAQVEFAFWGLDISGLPKLASPTSSRPYDYSYPLYLRNLQAANFDVLLIPLFETPRPRLSKALIKYYETAAAGALGIFSDVAQYRALPGDLTCLKTANDTQSWYLALKRAIDMPEAEFDLLRRRCIEHVREEFTASAQIDLHEAALRAVQFHGRTRRQRDEGGRPRVLYVLHSVYSGGAEIQLMRRWQAAQRYGIQPVVVIPAVLQDTEAGRYLKNRLALEGVLVEAAPYICYTEPLSPSEPTHKLDKEAFGEIIRRVKPALAHSITFIPALGQACQEANLPLVSTLYAVEDDFSWRSGRPGFRHCAVVQSDCMRYATRWGDLLGVPKMVARDTANRSFFELGRSRYLRALQADGSFTLPLHPGGPNLLVMGTYQPRKQQLETIRAAAKLKQEGLRFRLSFYGYTQFYPEYVEQCRQAIAHGGLQDCVFLNDFSDEEDALLSEADMLLSLSNYESFPGSIKDAFAAGLLVVATPVGGVAELVIDGVSGVLCEGVSVDALADGMRRALQLTDAERSRIAEQGRRVGRLELHPQRAANDLFRMYNLALDQAADLHPTAARPVSTVVIPDKNLTERGRVHPPAGPPLSLMPIGAGLTYTVRCDGDGWLGLDLLVELFSDPTPGVLELKLFTQAGAWLRTVCINAAMVRAGGYWCEFRFDPPLENAAGQVFRFDLTHQGANGAVVSVRQSSPPVRRELRLLNRLLRRMGLRLRGGAAHARMWYTR